jgi:hypothetical protein
MYIHMSLDFMASTLISVSRNDDSLAIVHKILIYIVHHSVCALVGIGTPPTPLPQASVRKQTEKVHRFSNFRAFYSFVICSGHQTQL